ncbi:YncE family protein [Conexibacter sp. SYSU D00693]|uniref:YncE family protein n=1 Tax=Conexibacter sp. SYSU D00693 TaxID=2812560 RepID=UPI00196B8AB4|nr:YncE family protein [Conexibacter sp. SYSU D00693]
MLRPCLAATAASLCLVGPAHASVVGPSPQPGVTRPAILVGNNWAGTTDVVDPDTFERLDRIDVIPDREERQRELLFRPDRLGLFLAVRGLIGEGHDQFNDDVFSSNDGSTIYVSRPSYADVVAIDLATKKIKWHAPVDGYRADHMAINKEGTRLLVSASTGNVVHELDTATGERVGEFPSGDSPHESVYSKDETTIYHASIGRVYSPVDQPKPLSDALAGGEFFQVVDAKTMQVRKRIDMGAKMAEAGYPGFSAAVRPMALAPDERHVYFQLSFFHGFVEYDLVEDRVTRVARLPVPEATKRIPRESYLLNSAHHGLALDPSGKRFCVAGTMADYAAIVDLDTLQPVSVIPGITKPYWSTNSADGRYCYVSASGSDELFVISYETGQVVRRFGVGWHPQRVRNGVVRIKDFPQGRYGETFRVGVTNAKLRVRRGATRVACRADASTQLAVQRCRVRLVRGGRLVAVGERAGAAAREFGVTVRPTDYGKGLLRRAGGRPVAVRMALRAVDSVGRVARVTRRASVG